ncbi:MAG: phosphatase PAP2 family protein [Sphingobacteriales bacterium]|nr:MAG: phosphatase PAP2 family protein [Sphingobacteriales bacterium]
MISVTDKNVPSLSGHKGFRIFMVLFLIWALAGGVLYATMGNHALFQAVHSTHTPALDHFFYYYTYVGDFVVIGPLLLLVWLLPQPYRNRRFFLLLVFTQLLPFLAVQGIKLLINAPRPSMVFGDADWFHRIAGLNLHTQLSFPSGHTAGAFACFTFLSLLLPARKAAWGVLFFILAFLVAYSRMYLGQHFFEDVYVGSLLGTLLCALLYIGWARIFRKR